MTAAGHPVCACAAALLLLSCADEPADAALRSEPLEVFFAGCAEVRRGPVCEIRGESELTFWLPLDPTTTIVVEADGDTAEAARSTIEGGEQLRVSVSAETRILAMRSAGRLFELRLARHEDDDRIAEAKALRRQGNLDEAAATLAPLLEGDHEVHRIRARGLSARISLSRGELDDALTGLARSSREATEAGLLLTAAYDAVARAETLRSRRFAYADASAALEALSPSTREAPGLRSLVSYHSALIARDEGRFRQAIQQLEDAEKWGRALGSAQRARHAGQVRARLRAELGQTTLAISEIENMVREPLDAPCEQAWLSNNAGWIHLLSGEGADLATARRHLLGAKQLFEGACPMPEEAHNVDVNLALLALRSGELEAARAHLEAARGGREGLPIVEAFSLDVSGRLALREGHGLVALPAFEEMARRADVAAPPWLRWRAHLGRGLTLKRLSRHAEARAALSHAEAILDEELLDVPLEEGHGTLPGARSESAQHLVEVLMELGEDGEALRVARHARRRSLARFARTDRIGGLDQPGQSEFREAVGEYRASRRAMAEADAGAWRVPLAELDAYHDMQDAERARSRAALDRAFAVLDRVAPSPLRPPGVGEALVVLSPIADGWALLVRDDRRTAGHRIRSSDLEGQRLAAHLLSPELDRLSRARAIRLLVPGALRDLDFHAVPFEGEPLFATSLVTWGVDLPSPPPTWGRRAVVLADPRGDLAEAATEGRSIARALEGATDVRLLEGARGTHGRVQSSLEDSRLFYYAGHGEALAGEGLRSALRLADGASLEAGDVLALSRGPERVFLIGCETARDNAPPSIAGMGIAQAFVVAGARSVVATNRPIEDAVAARFGRALLATGDRFDAEHARRAILRLRGELVEDDAWRSLRILVP